VRFLVLYPHSRRRYHHHSDQETNENELGGFTQLFPIYSR
jgi:hypothetical protein